MVERKPAATASDSLMTEPIFKRELGRTDDEAGSCGMDIARARF